MSMTAASGADRDYGAGAVRPRILALDALRGLAVLGIFMMNIQTFAMVVEAYGDPLAHMDFTGANRAVWFVAHLFFDLKFITIFSVLFGAGVAMTVRAGAPDDLSRHWRRMGVLFLIGAAHAFLFWYGDILLSYAVWGFVLPFALGARNSVLVIAGLVGAIVTAAGFWNQYQAWMAFGAEGWRPDGQAIAQAVDLYRAWWGERVARDAAGVAQMQFNSLIWYGPRVLGCMLIGVALYRVGFLTGAWRVRTYAVCALSGLAAGLIPMALTGQAMMAGDFAPAVMRWAMPVDHVASLFAAFGYAALVMLAARARLFDALIARLAAVGRMALSNYLAQTVFAALIFYGPPGFGLFGALERTDQLIIVVCFWIAQLWWSPLWLRRFRYGPMEWLWRSLSHQAAQPMLR